MGCHLPFFDRLIAAQGFFGHIVAGGFVGPGPAPPANPLVFTGAAFACQFIIIAEIHKNIGMLPNVTKTGLVTSPQFKSKNPQGWTIPVWEIKQNPVPPRHPRVTASRPWV